MQRRHYLRAIPSAVAATVAGLAGCTAPSTETADGGGAQGVETTADEEAMTETTTGTETTAADTQTTTEEAATGTTATGTETLPTEIAMQTAEGAYRFDPIGLFVEPGQTITWINESGAHSTTAYTEDNPQADVRRIPDDATGWNSEIIAETGGEFSHTFDVEGTYDYYCIPHKTLGMVARIVVGEPSGLDGDPPDGPVPSEQRIVDDGVVTQDAFNP